MNTTISPVEKAESYEAPRIDILGTVTDLTEWCVFGKNIGTPDYFDRIPISNCSA